MAHAADFITTTREWAGLSYSIQIPSDYTEVAGPAQAASVITAFAGPQRQDGTRPVVLITLADLPRLLGDAHPKITLAELGANSIKGTQKKREQWKVDVSDTTLGSVPVKRYSWTGVAIVPGRSPLRRAMAGVMFVGVEANIAFFLQTQDVIPYAKDSLPVGERSIRSFRLIGQEEQ